MCRPSLPWCLRWLCGLPAVLLSACAALSPLPPTAPLLHDALFDHPARPADADSVMALTPSMRDYLRTRLATAAREQGRPRALAEALFLRGELQLDYDASVTRTAAQAFAARSGNCLSLVVMTAALARELGLDVRFQQATRIEAYSRIGDLTVQSGHVNLVLAPRAVHWQNSALRYATDLDALQIDFLPAEQLRGLRSVPVGEQRVLAMFMNNRAVEALQAEGPAAAYAWAREALRQDAGFWPAINSLGVIYQRAGHWAAAAAAFEQVLALDPDNLPALANLPPVLQALGRDAEALHWTARRLALQPHPPFHHLALAAAALDRGDLAAAREHLSDEASVTGDSHELFFQRARLQLAIGRDGPARAALQAAVEHSQTALQRQRYAAKLDRLQTLGER